MPDYQDERIARAVRLLWHLAGMQDSSRPNYELADRLVAEFEHDFPGAAPGDRERAMTALRRMTST